jgi:hypothetical protein
MSGLPANAAVMWESNLLQRFSMPLVRFRDRLHWDQGHTLRHGLDQIGDLVIAQCLVTLLVLSGGQQEIEGSNDGLFCCKLGHAYIFLV